MIFFKDISVWDSRQIFFTDGEVSYSTSKHYSSFPMQVCLGTSDWTWYSHPGCVWAEIINQVSQLVVY